MRIGMMWFDNDPKDTLEIKIHRAVGYYMKRYGAEADKVYVNPRMLPPEGVSVPGVIIEGSKSIQMHHFWVGCEHKI